MRSLAQEFSVVWSCDEVAAGRFDRSKPLLLRLCDNRQNHANRCLFFDFALGFDVAAVELRDMFDDRKAKACASDVVVAARLVDAVESLKNARQIVVADADPVVAYTQHDLLV